jgi:ABC-type branched-subunit amino acid transport system substrate-binding protein
MYLYLVTLLVSLFALSVVAAEPPIRLGMSAPLSTKAGALGKDYRDGANLVFQQVNIDGGIQGRAIELVCLDDGYEPVQTVNNTRQLLNDPKLFALFGYIGTPTVNSVLPLLRKSRVPFIAPFTGAQLIRQPQDDFVFNFRASYAEEIQRQVAQLIDQQGMRRIGLLVQADEFGASVEQLIIEALKQRQLAPLIVTRYKRNSDDIGTALQQLRSASPELVMTVGHYQAIANAIAIAQQHDFHPAYSVVSFTGVSELRKQIKPPYVIYASTVMPLPDATNPSRLVQSYLVASKKTATHKPSDVGLEGFASAKIVVGALKSCGKNLTRQCLLSKLPQQQLDDFLLSYQSNSHQASDQVFMFKITENSLTEIFE